MVPLLSMGYAALVDNNVFLGYKWVTKNCGFAVNQALFDALLPNTFSKQPAKKTSGARHIFRSNSSGLFALAQQIVGGPSRTADLGPCFWETFCGE